MSNVHNTHKEYPRTEQQRPTNQGRRLIFLQWCERRCSGVLLIVVGGVYQGRLALLSLGMQQQESGSLHKVIVIKQIVQTEHSSPDCLHHRLHGNPPTAYSKNPLISNRYYDSEGACVRNVPTKLPIQVNVIDA